MVVGNGHSAIHEVAVVDALKHLGHQVKPFYWHSFLNSSSWLLRLWRRLQNKFLVGSMITKINLLLIQKSLQFEPELIFIYRGTHIKKNTIQKIKKLIPSCFIYGYNNDDPFSNAYPFWLWRHFIKSIPFYDIVFAYRHSNLVDFKENGAKQVELLRSWYLPYLHKPLDFSVRKNTNDCIFVGHYEKDGRAECLESLTRIGINLQLAGPYSGLKDSGWDIPVKNSKILQSLLPISYLSGHQYVEAIRNSRMALCFLSKLNRDTYTRRCFEIPAIGTVLVSEYTDDLSTLFIEDKEAIFFRSKGELVNKVKYYLANPDLLENIRLQGMQRVIQGGHDIYSRVNYVLKFSGKI